MLALCCLLLALLLPAAPAQAAPRASATVLPACSWNRPGHNPFTGDLVAAVDHYTDIPAPVRARLKQRMAARQYDEIVQIRRDSIDGRHSYEPTIRGMHFGEGAMCTQVSRARWADTALERGLVYCDSGSCLLVPTVCRNLSRIVRNEGAPAPTVAGSAADGLLPPGVVPLFPEAALGELVFDPPGAGVAQADPSSFEEAASAGGWGVGLPGLAMLGGGAGGGAGRGGSGGGSGGGFVPSPLPGGGGGGGGVPEAPAAQLPHVVPAVPEPGTWVLMALGLLALLAVQRRRHAGG